MSSQDWNPLSYFRELGTLPKVLLLLGFIFLGAGLVQGVSPHNRTIILAVSLISLSLSCHYFSQSRWQEPGPPYKMHFDWWKFGEGTLLLIVTLIFVCWLYAERGVATEITPTTAGAPLKSPDESRQGQPASTKGDLSNDAVRKSVNEQGTGTTRQVGGRDKLVVPPNVTHTPAVQPPTHQNCPNGICIGGDNKGSATVVNGRPSWKLDDTNLGNLSSAFQENGRPVCVISATTDGDSKDLANQLCAAAKEANCMGTVGGGYVSTIERAAAEGLVHGLECYADSARNRSLIGVQKSLTAVGLQCGYKGITFSARGVSFCEGGSGTVLVVGNMPTKDQ